LRRLQLRHKGIISDVLIHRSTAIAVVLPGLGGNGTLRGQTWEANDAAKPVRDAQLRLRLGHGAPPLTLRRLGRVTVWRCHRVVAPVWSLNHSAHSLSGAHSPLRYRAVMVAWLSRSRNLSPEGAVLQGPLTETVAFASRFWLPRRNRTWFRPTKTVSCNREERAGRGRRVDGGLDLSTHEPSLGANRLSAELARKGPPPS